MEPRQFKNTRSILIWIIFIMVCSSASSESHNGTKLGSLRQLFPCAFINGPSSGSSGSLDSLVTQCLYSTKLSTPSSSSRSRKSPNVNFNPLETQVSQRKSVSDSIHGANVFPSQTKTRTHGTNTTKAARTQDDWTLHAIVNEIQERQRHQQKKQRLINRLLCCCGGSCVNEGDTHGNNQNTYPVNG
eukprot:717115_1